MLFSQVEKRRCAQCWGKVVMKKIDDEWIVICPKGCEPGGHVSEDYVQMMETKDAIEAGSVAENYPELAGKKQKTQEEIQDDIETLYG